MGLLSSIASIAAPIAGTIFGGPVGGAIGGAIGGLLGSKDAPSSATATNQQKLDPRIDGMLFGQNGSQGLLSQYQGYLNQPQSQALQGYGATAGSYLTNNGAADMDAIRGAAGGLLSPNGAPATSPSAWAVGNQVQAPSQNNIDLTGSYNNLLSGGNTAALDKSLQSAVDLTNQAFQKNQTDLTNNLQRNILPGIRNNSVLAGQYGGSRQGVAEGNAISDYTNQLTSANTTLGMANSANTTAQQAQAYQQGQDRALAATQGLGAQQYGVASQNANTKNQAEFLNVGNVQQSNLANQGAQLQTNAQNNSAALGGAGLLGGLSSAAYGTAQNADNAGINRATQVNGLLAPYLGANSSSTTSQPLYQNTGNSVLGGALAGGQLAGLFGGAGSSPGSGSVSAGAAGNLLSAQDLGNQPINTGLLSNAFNFKF
jgi:hypothetical protein